MFRKIRIITNLTLFTFWAFSLVSSGYAADLCGLKNGKIVETFSAWGKNPIQCNVFVFEGDRFLGCNVGGGGGLVKLEDNPPCGKREHADQNKAPEAGRDHN